MVFGDTPHTCGPADGVAKCKSAVARACGPPSDGVNRYAGLAVSSGSESDGRPHAVLSVRR